MGLPQIAMMLVMLGGFAAYWWWKSGRHGGNAYKVSLGLRADEPDPASVWNGYFKIGFEKKDVALAMVGVERVGKSFTLALTTGGEAVLCPRGDDPVRYRRGTFTVETAQRDVDSLVGASGQKEPADVFLVQPAGSEGFHVVLPRSAGEQLATWARG